MNKVLRGNGMAASPSENSTEELALLEPRIMFDASIDWAITTGGDLEAAELMLGLMQSYSSEFEAVFETLKDDFEDVLGDNSELFSLDTDDADTNLGEISDILSRINGAVSSVFDAYQDQLSIVFEDVRGELATDFIGAIVTSFDDTDFDAAFVDAFLSETDIDRMFGADAMLAGDTGVRISAYIDSIAALEVDSGAVDEGGAPIFGPLLTSDQVDDVRTVLETEFAGFFNDAVTDAQRASLTELNLLDVSFFGTDVVTFTQGATSQEVSVEVTLPPVETLLESLGVHPDFDMSLPVDFEFLATSGAFTFDISANSTEAVEDPASPASVGIEFTNFEPDMLFTVGGNSQTSIDRDVTVGFLSGQLKSYETAQITLGLDWGEDASLSTEIAIDDTDLTDNATSNFAPVLDLTIRELGESGLADAVTLDADQAYDLIRFNVDTDLQFAAAATSFISFDTEMTLSAALGELSSAVSVQDRFDAASVDIVFDTFDLGTLSATEEQARAMAEAFFITTPEMIAAHLENLGNGVADFLRSDDLSLGIPFTDIDVFDGFDAISDVFAGIADSFRIDPAELGFVDDNSFAVAQDVDSQTGVVLNADALERLVNLSSMTVELYDSAGSTSSLTVDFSELDTADDIGNLPADFLSEFAETFNTALAGSGWAITAVNGALQFVASSSNTQLFRITGSVPRAPLPDSEDYGFGDLGLAARMLREIEVTDDDGATSLIQTLDISFGQSVVDLGTFDADVLTGISTLRFNVEIDGVPQYIDIFQPDTGWDGPASVSDQLNIAFADRGIAVSVGLTAGDAGLSFAHNGSDSARYVIGVDESSLSRAQDMSGLISWTAERLDDVLPGATLTADVETGEILLTADTIERELQLNRNLVLDSSAFEGLTSISAIAALDGSIIASLDMAAGFNILDIQADYAAQPEDDKDAAQVMLDNSYITDLTLAATIDAEASEIIGAAQIGLMEAGLGLSGDGDNFAKFNATFESTLVGETDSAFSEKIAMTQLIAVAEGTDGAAVSDLVGRFDLVGGIVTDYDNGALDSTPGTALSATDLVIADDTTVLGPNQFLSSAYFGFGDVSLNAGELGIDTSTLNTSFGLSIENVFDPINTARVFVDGFGELGCLLDVSAGVIMDALTSVSQLLQNYAETLAEEMPLLNRDLPVMNASIMDSLDFASGFLEALASFQEDPNFTFATLDALLENVFGADNVTLAWDSADCTLTFDLNLSYLTEFEDVQGFNVGLVDLLGEVGAADLVGPELSDILSNLVDARGDAELVFDPDIYLDFSFGIDLGNVLPTVVMADADTRLENLATVFGLQLNDNGDDTPDPDFRIIWNDLTALDTGAVTVDLNGAETLGDALDRVNAALDAGTFGSSVSASYDPATGRLTLEDSNTDIRDTDGVDTGVIGVDQLFDAGEVASDDTGFGEIAFDAGFADFASALEFEIALNDGTSVLVSLDADIARTTAEGFAAALNTAFQVTVMARTDLSSTALPGTQIALSQLLRATVNGSNELKLEATNFGDFNGYDAFTFAVMGRDISHEVQFTIEEIGDSNAARALGLPTEAVVDGNVTSSAIIGGVGITKPIVFIDTENTSMRGELLVGAPDGLNMIVALGPLEASIENGQAFIGSSTGDHGYVEGTVLDIDGINDGRYDLSHMLEIAAEDEPDYLALFGLDVDFTADVDLPFSGLFGTLKPDEHGFIYNSVLISTVGSDPISLSDLAADPGAQFEGDVIEIYENGFVPRLAGDVSYAPHQIELNLPVFDTLLDCDDIFQLLNDPDAILNGLDMIFGTIQDFVDDYLAQIDLPIIGESIDLGAQFLRDLRYDLIVPAEDWISERNDDGTQRTTTDLVNDYFNEQMNTVFGTANVTYVQLDSFDSSETHDANSPFDTSEPYLYGAFHFEQELFNELLNIGFELDIPGLNLGTDKASQIRFTSVVSASFGFGLDCNGFFVLNKVDPNSDVDNDGKPDDVNEMNIRFIVDAENFSGNLNMSNILGLGAAETSGHGAEIIADFGINLFGDAGQDLNRDFSGVTLDGSNTFGNTIYTPQIDFANLAEFAFDANIDISLDLDARILDPTRTDGEEITVNGRPILPTVSTTFVFVAEFDPAEHGVDLMITEMAFEDVSINVRAIYDGLLAPIFDPIMPMLTTLESAFSWLESEPLSYAFEPIRAAFPLVGLADSIIQLASQFGEGDICLGTYDFLGYSGDTLMSEFTINNARFIPCLDLSFNVNFPNLNVGGPGVTVEVPLLTDPFAAFNLLVGNFSQVDLVTVELLLFEADFNIDLVNDLLSQIGAPGWISGAISRGLDASVALDFYAGFNAGYDLSGVVNFANTYDPIRLLDGVYINSAPGNLISAQVDGRISLNAGIAGASASLGAGVELNFNDPNDDGRLRIPELIAMAESFDNYIDGGGSNVETMLGYFFEGSFDFNASMRVWAGINLPWPLPDLSFSTTVFPSIGISYNLPGTPLDARIADNIGGTNFLNVGARAGATMSNIQTDGNDYIRLTDNGGNYYVDFASNGVRLPGGSNFNISQSAPVVVQAGEGNNYIDLAQVGGTSVTYAGKGSDNIILGDAGLHVVFAGGGNDTITANGSGNYYIFAEDGADTVTVNGSGSATVFSGDDFNMREKFLAEFAQGGVTNANIYAMLGAANYSTNGVNYNLTGITDNYTALTQLNASSAREVVTINGGGSHTILTGSGDDLVAVNGGSSANVYTGAGDDQITATSGTVHAEGGAGEDLIVLGNGSNTAYGWGVNADTNEHLARADGDDIIVGGTGADNLFGQFGKDVLSGNLGNDRLDGGLDNDLISGGVLHVVEANSGNEINLSTPGALEQLQTRLNVTTLAADGSGEIDDGTDTIIGGSGSDVLFGGSGSDDMSGGTGADILIGDFGDISVSANRIAETFISTGMDATLAGSDVLNGGGGNDILVAGGSASSNAEVVTDLLGNNIVFGDFGVVEGARILENVNAYRSLASDFGTDDIITTGLGNDVILGGEGNDTITSGTGADVIFGDLGEFVVGDGTLSSIADANDGDDEINTGDATTPGDKLDLVIGGNGSDTITSVDGGITVLGDYGNLVLDPVGIQALFNLTELSATATDAEIAAHEEQLALIAGFFRSMESVSSADAGNDTLATGQGDVYAVLGGGSDTALLGDGLVYLVADDGRIEASIEDGTVAAETRDSANFGDDNITSGNGRDIILAGGGSDILDVGDDLNIILTDSGRVLALADEDALPISITSTESTSDGDETYTGGVDQDFVVLGGGDDFADLGDGVNYVLGDNGTMGVTGSGDDAIVTFGSSDTSNAGNDTLTGAAGRDVMIGGNGADVFNTGEGNNVVLGDSGAVVISNVATRQADQVISSAGSADGNDTVTAGAGDDLAILGLGDDLATFTGGDNRVVGDRGQILTALNGTQAVSSTDPELGGNDTITTGAGSDILFGGEGADTLIAGAGNDVVVGDAASSVADAATGETQLNVLTGNYGGNDQIELGEGNDLALGGLGDDMITTGNGEDIVLGDLADVRFINQTDVEEISLTRTDAGGDDTIDAAGTTGDNILIGQFGTDVLIGGENDDWMIGDLATIELTTAAAAQPGQSAVDRIASVVHVANDVAFDDSLSGGAGSDFLLGGFGADELIGGTEQDFLFGDTIQLFREFDPLSDIETMLVETNFAFTEGGLDYLDGGDGPDIMIGGLGADLFIGNTEDDLLIGDSFAGTFGMRLTTSGFFGLTPERELITVNFAGPTPNDLVSGEQVGSSIGFYLSTSDFMQAFGEIGYTPLSIGGVETPAEAAERLAAVVGYFKSEDVLGLLAQLMYFNVDLELIEADLEQGFRQMFASLDIEPTAYQLSLFKQLLARLLGQLENNETPNPGIVSEIDEEQEKAA